MDEPTSNIDAETDARIQSTLISSHLQGVTVLTVAHRLNTIVDYDRVLVMEGGRLLEQGAPAALLEEGSGSAFRRMAAELGRDELAVLQARANAGR